MCVCTGYTSVNMLKHVMLRPFAEQLSALGQSESEEDAPEHLPEPMAFRLHICLVFTLTAPLRDMQCPRRKPRLPPMH